MLMSFRISYGVVHGLDRAGQAFLTGLRICHQRGFACFFLLEWGGGVPCDAMHSAGWH